MLLLRSSGHGAGAPSEVAPFFPPGSKPTQTPSLQDPIGLPDISLRALVPSCPQGSPQQPVPVPGAPAAVGLSPAGRVPGQASRWLLHPSLRSRRGRRAEREPCPALPAAMSAGKGEAGAAPRAGGTAGTGGGHAGALPGLQAPSALLLLRC